MLVVQFLNKKKVIKIIFFIDVNCWIAETEKGIFDAILQGHIDFESAPWPSISSSAKDLIHKMLTQDPKKRITSAQVLGIVSLLFLVIKSRENLKRFMNIFLTLTTRAAWSKLVNLLKYWFQFG